MQHGLQSQCPASPATRALALFVVLVGVTIRLGGVMPIPSGSVRQRTIRQLVTLIPLGLGAVAATLYGLAGFAIVFGVGLGAVVWVQLTRYTKGERP